MIPAMLMAVIADLVFDSIAKANRVYEAEIEQYFRERRFVTRTQPKPAR